MRNKLLVLVSIIIPFPCHTLAPLYYQTRHDAFNEPAITIKQKGKVILYCLEFILSFSGLILTQFGEESTPNILAGIANCLPTYDGQTRRDDPDYYNGFVHLYLQLPFFFSLGHSIAGIYQLRKEIAYWAKTYLKKYRTQKSRVIKL